MRIGLVTGEYPPMPGGVGDFTRVLASGLARLGGQIHVLTSRQGRDAGGVDVHVHPYVDRWSFTSMFRLRDMARRLMLDIVNIQYQAAAYGLSAPIHFLPRIVGVKCVVTFHDLRIPYLFPKAGRLRPAAINELARQSSGVIVTDPADQAALEARIRHPRLVQIPIGSNIALEPPPAYDRAAWRLAAGVAPGALLLGYFGFLSESKGGDTLLRALAMLRDRKANVRLVLIGGARPAPDSADHAFEAGLERLIAHYDLADCILRTGFVNPADVSAWLLACDAAVLPYRDGASFRRGSLLAALAHGVPVITTQPAHPAPQFVNGENVRLVPPDLPEALVLAISEFMASPGLSATLSAGARALAPAFGWDAIARRTLDFYRSL